LNLLTDSTNAIHTLRVLDAFGIAAMMCDTDGVVQLLNNAAAALFSHEPGYFDGRSLRSIPGFEALLQLLDSNQPQVTPLQCYIQDHLHCLVRMQHVGRSVRMFTFEDVTTFKEREDQQNAVLHMVAHDLNTPLSAINSFVDLVAGSGEVNTKQQHFLERIQLAERTMSGLVRDLLDIAWIDSGQPIEATMVSVAFLVRSAADTLENHASKREINMQMSIAPGLPQMRGDAQRLERVFTNLISNAIKYTPIGGSVQITVEQNAHGIVVAVTDSGIGIAAEHLPHIFDRFYRVPRDHDGADGTGLGLSIVKAIVERHQGRVEVISEVDKGSTFTVYLPVAER
jgi:signal transduction histidine kinase